VAKRSNFQPAFAGVEEVLVWRKKERQAKEEIFHGSDGNEEVRDEFHCQGVIANEKLGWKGTPCGCTTVTPFDRRLRKITSIVRCWSHVLLVASPCFRLRTAGTDLRVVAYA
jgi:hypothetical protein